LQSSEVPRFLRVALIWNGGVVDERILHKPGDIRVGEGLKNTFTVPAEGYPESHVLFRHTGKGYVVRLSDKMSGKLAMGDEVRPISDVLKGGGAKAVDRFHELPIGPADWGIVGLDEKGELGFFFQFVSRPDKAARGGAALDRNLVQSVALAFVMHLSFLILLYAVYEPAENLKLEATPERFMSFKLTEPEKPKEEPKEQVKEEVGKKHMNEEGKFGEKESKHKESIIPKARRDIIKQKVSKRGLLGAIGTSGGMAGFMKKLGGESGIGSELEQAMNGLSGNTLQVGRGNGGWGTRGTGVKAQLGGRKERKVKISVSHGQPSVDGFLSPEQIRRVVLSHKGGIQFCYEKELQRIPNLSGKIDIVWTINLEGKVIKARVESSSMNNAAVEGCITRSIRRWIFPKPQGGHCIVKWPFIFKGGL
jgi:hypothetical protein